MEFANGVKGRGGNIFGFYRGSGGEARFLTTDDDDNDDDEKKNSMDNERRI